MSRFIYVEVVGARGHDVDKFWVDYEDPGECRSLGARIRKEFERGYSVHSIPVAKRGDYPFVIVVGGRP